jgi:hypothetical protein
LESEFLNKIGSTASRKKFWRTDCLIGEVDLENNGIHARKPDDHLLSLFRVYLPGKPVTTALSLAVVSLKHKHILLFALYAGRHS